MVVEAVVVVVEPALHVARVADDEVDDERIPGHVDCCLQVGGPGRRLHLQRQEALLVLPPGQRSGCNCQVLPSADVAVCTSSYCIFDARHLAMRLPGQRGDCQAAKPG